MRTFELLLSWVVTTALLFVLVIADERRMSEERLERAWPPASRDAAVVALGILALPFHFARTRGRFFSLSLREHLRWWMGLGLGLVLAVLVALVNAAIVAAFDWAVGLPID